MTIIQYLRIGLFLSLIHSSYAWATTPIQVGRDYEKLQRSTILSNASSDSSSLSNKEATKELVTLFEFFNYACPACSTLEPKLEQWLKKKPKHVVFKRIPVIFHADWDYFAKVYLIAESLNLADSMTPAIFSELSQVVDPSAHALTNPQTMDKLFTKHGAQPGQFLNALNHSPKLTYLLRRSMQTAADFNITAVPSFVVQGQYKTDLQYFKENPSRLFETLDYLIQQSKIKP